MPQSIPLHQLKSRANAGIEIQHFTSDGVPKDTNKLGAHRDDHYLFFLLAKGAGSVMVDFNELNFHDKMLCYIAPGQVHHYLSSEILDGWYLAVDTSLVPAAYRDIFEGNLLTQRPVVLDEHHFAEAEGLLKLLNKKFNEDQHDAFRLPVAYSLMQAFVGVVAGCYSKTETSAVKAPRSAELARQFKTLLTANFISLKSPSAYAALLNVTEGYLNEVLKKMTGFSVSVLITNEVMLEAKRLLYYSDLNVKEIAHQLGYEDHTYFSRMFKKNEGETPLDFRSKYRK